MSIITKIALRSNWRVVHGHGFTRQKIISGNRRFFAQDLNPTLAEAGSSSSKASSSDNIRSGAKKVIGVLAGGAITATTGWMMMTRPNEKVVPTELQITPKDRERLDQELSHITNDPELYQKWNGQRRQTIRIQLARSVWTNVLAGSDETEISLEKFRKRVQYLVEQKQQEHSSQEETQAIPMNDTYQEEALLQVFAIADVNRDGYISFAEFYRALSLILLSDVGDEGALHELLYEAIDMDGNGEIDQEELLHFIQRLKAVGGVPKNDQISKSNSLFFLTQGTRPATAEEICEQWLKKFDINGDRKISRDEFHRMAQEIDFSKSFIGRDFLLPRKCTVPKAIE